MKIAVLTASNYDTFAISIICRLQKQGDAVSHVVCMKSMTYRNIKGKLKQEGLGYLFMKARDRLFSRFRGSDYHVPHPDLHEYLHRLAPHPPSSIREASKRMRFTLQLTKDINSERAISFLRSAVPDLLIYAGGGIIRKPLIEIPKIGIINAHMGLLPRYRGMNVLEWSLFHGDQIGVTVHFISEGVDTGPILLQRNIEIENGDTIDSLRDKSLPMSVEMLAETVSGLRTGQIDRIEQRKDEGKQYFVMHDRLKDLVERKRLASK